MMHRYYKILFVCLCLSLLGTNHLFALEHRVLANGLEVFVEENHAVPLANIRVSFRAGATVETPELDGLCHLYEHMLFKGNEMYRDQNAFNAALKGLGVGSWNGGTSLEYATYFFTIPSEALEDGMKFWAYAVKSPLLKKEELNKEITVVHSEIAGRKSEPTHFLRKARREALYSADPHRLDIGGSLDIIDAATVEKLRYIKDRYYVPNNAALFVAGDVDPQKVFALAEAYYGDWKGGETVPALGPHPPLVADKWAASSTSPQQGIVDVLLTFRGPDAGQDEDATYPADVWGQMANAPRGRFKQAMAESIPDLFGGSRYVSGGYFTQRYAGETQFGFKLAVSDSDLWGAIVNVKEAVRKELSEMVREGYFSPQEIGSAKTELTNLTILSKETSGSFMQNLSFWWASTSTRYYLDYIANIEKVRVEDVRRYVSGYLHKPVVVTIWINKQDDEKHGITRMVEEQADPDKPGSHEH